MKTFVICSSQKHREPLNEFIAKLRKLGVRRILEPDFTNLSDRTTQKEESERLQNQQYRSRVPGLVYQHLYQRIMPADVVFVFNKDGYIGHNTFGEIFFAAAHNKLIYTLEPKLLVHGEEEICVDVLIHGIVSTPGELKEVLQ